MDNSLEAAIALDQWLEQIYVMDANGELTPETISRLLQEVCEEFGISEEAGKRAIFSVLSTD